MDIVYLIGTLLSALAAVLAWLAKLFWSKEYISAKDEIIKAKEAQIETLRSQVDHYKELTPMKIQEYFHSVKEQLEEYNDALQLKLEKAKSQIEEKSQKLEKLQKNDKRKKTEIETIEKEKGQLEKQVAELEEDLIKLRKNEEEFNTIRIPKIDVSALTSVSKMVNESLTKNLGNQLAQISNSMEYLKGMADSIPLETVEEMEMALWFVDNFEDPANSVPYESKEGGYQYFSDEPYNAREVLFEKYPETDKEVIESVVEYLETISLEWVKKDRMIE